MELRAGYKQTKVGIIPTDWECIEISKITNLVGDGIHSTPIYSGSGQYYFVNGNNLNNGKIVFTKDTKTVDFSEYKIHKKPLGSNSLLLSINGTIGNVAYYQGEDIVLGKSAAFLNVDKLYAREYLYYSLQTTIVNTQFSDGLTGSTIKNLGLGTIRSTLVPVPRKKAEQTAIAKALSSMDELIQSLEKLIEKKQLIKRGAVQKLLNPFDEDGELKDGWNQVSYGEAFSFLSTAAYSRSDLGGDGALYIHYGDIHTKFGTHVDLNSEPVPTLDIDKVATYAKLKDGDLIMADASEDYDGIGKSFEVSGVGEKVIIAGLHTFLMRPKGDHFTDGFKGFIHEMAYVKSQLNQKATGLKVYGVSKNTLKDILIPYPCETMQSQVVSALKDIDYEIQALSIKLGKSKKLKQGMMQALLTGQIRLVKPEQKEA